MTKNEIFEGLKEVIALVKPKLDLSNITVESNLLTEVGLDSLTMLFMTLGMEQKFGIKFDGSGTMFQTVSDVIDYIYAALNK